MNREKLNIALEKAELQRYIEFVEALFMPAIQVKHLTTSPQEIKSSIGGIPKLPADFNWPKHERGLHTLILAIDCSELPQNHLFPEKGVIYFFAAHDK